MIKEFKEFIARGNVLDMAVGLVMGAAFKAIVDSLVADLITPILNVFLNGVNFQEWTIQAGSIEFAIGNFLNAVFSFLVIAFVMFMLIKAVNRMHKPKEAAPAKTKTCPYCKSEVDIDATRCPHCTSTLE